MAKHNIFKNKRGASIEIGKIRPNTYNEYCGCTVDIQIFVYNRTMNRRCKFWLVDYDTSWSGDDLLSGLYESELENNEDFDEEMEKYVWDAIISEWDFYPEVCAFIDYINPIEDTLNTMAEQVFKDYGDVIDPEIDELLVSPARCWDELDEEDLIDFADMAKDDVVYVEEHWGEKDYTSLVEDFEKEDRTSETESDRPMDEAIERAIAYCKEHDTRCLALPYAICKAMCETSFVLPRAIFVRLNSKFQTTDWESEEAAAAGLLQLRSDLLKALKKSRWVDVDNRHYKRYEYCDDIIDERNKTLQKLVTLLESMCNVRSHDVNHNYVYGPDISSDIRQLKEDYNVVMPHKILYDFLVNKKQKEEYSKQILRKDSSYYDDEEYVRSRLAFICDDVFTEIDVRMKEGCLKDVFDADILLKEYEGETFVQQILDSESDDDFYKEDSHGGDVISHGISYYCSDHIYTYQGSRAEVPWVAENPGFMHVAPKKEWEYRGHVHIPSTVQYNGRLYPVSTISCMAFYECEDLKEVTIDEGVTEIESKAFAGCSRLERVVLPSTLKSIGDDAFDGCPRLKEIKLPEGLEHMGNNAFK